MQSENSIQLSQIVRLAGNGSEDAANKLATYFLGKANSATRDKLRGKSNKEEEEDIAQSALKSFCLGIQNGRYEYQGDKQLYGLLHKIIDNKIQRMWQYHFAQKRDIRMRADLEHDPEVLDQPALVAADSIIISSDEQAVVDRILPELQVELLGLFQNLLGSLSEHPRRLLLTMLESDATNEELAKTIGRSVASVERYRTLIRSEIKSLGDE